MTRRVLVPMDGSRPAEDGLRHALSEYPDTDITVLHVVNPIDAFYRAPELSDWKAWYEEASSEANEIFADAQAIGDEYGVEISTATATGRPDRAIIEYTADHDINHIVIGSHGRTGDARTQLGSVAEAVVRRSPVLVTVIR